MSERTVEIGKLTVKGQSAAFTPDPQGIVTLSRGERLRIVVPYRYEEASDEKESCLIVLTTRVADEPATASEAHVRDRVGVHDEAWGALAHETRLVDRGSFPVRFHLKATMESAPWSGGAAVTDAFEWSGKLTVRVE